MDDRGQVLEMLRQLKIKRLLSGTLKEDRLADKKRRYCTVTRIYV